MVPLAKSCSPLPEQGRIWSMDSRHEAEATLTRSDAEGCYWQGQEDDRKHLDGVAKEDRGLNAGRAIQCVGNNRTS